MIKLIVAGGREFSDYVSMKAWLDHFLKNVTEQIEIVSGGCSSGALTFVRGDGTKVFGADGLGEKYAADKNYPVKIFPAEWDRYGNEAGPIRNTQMAEYSTHSVCFWNGKSSGTGDMIKKLKNRKLKTRIVMYKK